MNNDAETNQFLKDVLEDYRRGAPPRISGSGVSGLASKLLVAAAVATMAMQDAQARDPNIFEQTSNVLGAVREFGFAKKELERAGKDVNGGKDVFETAKGLDRVVRASGGVYRIIERNLPAEPEGRQQNSELPAAHVDRRADWKPDDPGMR